MATITEQLKYMRKYNPKKYSQYLLWHRQVMKLSQKATHYGAKAVNTNNRRYSNLREKYDKASDKLYNKNYYKFFKVKK